VKRGKTRRWVVSAREGGISNVRKGEKGHGAGDTA
jgi:hypothetical protein